MVFAGLYPVESHEHGLLRDALEKLRLNDSAFNFEPENSVALGFGFRCGFLGLLHMEIIQERLEREFNIDLITTAPGVRYRVTLTNGEVIEVDNPTKFPESVRDQADRRADHRRDGDHARRVHRRDSEAARREARDAEEIRVHRRRPRAAALRDAAERDRARFLRPPEVGIARLRFARLPPGRISRLADGEAGRPGGGRAGGRAVDHRAPRRSPTSAARLLIERLRKLIPRQMFEVALQAAIGSKIIARETIPAMRKNVLAKCYGGDITRKRKLLEKQKEGKRA